MSFRSAPLLPLLLAFAPVVRAATFPANSPEPMTEDAPVKGLPGYDDDDGDSPLATDTGSASGRGKTQTLPSQFGMTLITPVAGTLEQRIPVSMNRGASGRMSAWSYGGEASLQHVTPDFYAYLNFDYKRSDFDFAGTGPAPWEDLDQYRLATHVEGSLGGNWRWFADGGVAAALEKDAAFGDSLTGRAALGAKYRFSPHFAYYFGITTITRLDRSALVLPITAFEIRLDRWTVRSLNGLVVAYDVYGDNALTFDLSATYENPFFRMRPAPAGTGRTVEFQEVPLTFGATRALGEHGFVRAYASVILWSDYRFATHGSTTGDFQTDPGLLFGLSAGARF